ncbi:MAG: VanZ family protein [Verrucomicrobiota bacterium]|nr:VanZ family protein [Limisphaera sp.]MDW8381153.1 VanZ family protein [Verrucomicrobiota bacterium]
MVYTKRGWCGNREPRLWLLATAGFTALLLYLTHLPNSDVPAWITRWGDDKFRHVTAYGLWAFLALGASQAWCARRGRAVASVLLIAGVLAALDELSQPRFGRTCSLWDYAAGVLGAAAGCAAMLTLETLRPGPVAEAHNIENDRESTPTDPASRKWALRPGASNLPKD